MRREQRHGAEGSFASHSEEVAQRLTHIDRVSNWRNWRSVAGEPIDALSEVELELDDRVDVSQAWPSLFFPTLALRSPHISHDVWPMSEELHQD